VKNKKYKVPLQAVRMLCFVIRISTSANSSTEADKWSVTKYKTNSWYANCKSALRIQIPRKMNNNLHHPNFRLNNHGHHGYQQPNSNKICEQLEYPWTSYNVYQTLGKVNWRIIQLKTKKSLFPDEADTSKMKNCVGDKISKLIIRNNPEFMN
jgi:hypothetical protein